MRYYPLFLDLAEARCLLVGAGRVGRRKAATLLECRPASLLVLDPGMDEAAFRGSLSGMDCAPLSCEARSFRPEDIEGVSLVFAATPSAEVNSAIARLCRASGVLCNVAGPLEEDAAGSFIVPAHVEDGPLVLALSTSGGSPALARALKEDLESWLGAGYSRLVRLLEALRPRLLALGLGSDADAEIFRAICARPLRDRLMAALAERDAARTDALLAAVLPAALSFSALEIVHGMD
ncbi:MAG: bifunctional precorrin-2 dehydrogenase/sirohydrochlorin ferrochelatase [Mailhella sp.]|nr:bifunctional precorrin-2 dehydrogenase/sirohydrochlorin ferrochelatase [Mailhella sp.]MBQ4325927.1 bifunctional precorrin-2 dehydrogenase/sirohydrochlorin ferrochelatase [Mailhella sp.]